MSNRSKRISKAEFFEMFNDADAPKTAARGKADWDAIYAELKKCNEPLDIKTIFEEYVKCVVTRQRTKNVVKAWAVQGKCKQIWKHGRYWFYFGRTPRKRKAPKLE